MGEALGNGHQSLGTEGRSGRLGAGAGGGAEGAWRLSNWRLRTKLLAVLLIPLVSAVVFGGLHIWDGFSEASSYQRTHEQVRLENATDDLVHRLQRERDLSVVRVAAGRSDDPAPLTEARANTDGELNALNGMIAEVDPDISGRFRTEAENLSARLRSLRDSVDHTNYPAEGVLRTYSQSIEGLLNLGQLGVSSIRESDLLRLTLATNSIADAQEAASTRGALLNDVLRTGQFRTNQDRELLAAEARNQAAASDFTAVASPEQQQRYQDTVTGAEVDRANSMAQTALALDAEGQGLRSLNPQEWDAVSNRTVDLINQVGNELRGDLEQASADAAQTAWQRTVLAAVATLLALIVALAVALIVARSLLGSLRTLRRSALDVADRRLPDAVQSILNDTGPSSGLAHIEPIPVQSREEVGKVARAFDAVHSQALRLASEQALLRNNVNDLFVNLARRSQTLVQRQLSLIDQLEQDEQDPDQLSSLFELDHLATRMRRNNENLLILGGTDLARRMMRPVPLTEVVGAAVSEVEQYTRIAVGDSPDLGIQGRVVNDFVHLVAELLENATVFSNPDTEVSVRVAYRRAELVLEIRDRGVGIDSAELGEINERLTRPPEIDVAVSRRMGLYVVGQLAQRHGIRVELRNNGDLEGGVTASVRLSGEYVVQLTPDGPRPMPDAQRVSSEDRDTSDTGTHLGLAAAFGGAAGRDGAQQPAVESGAQQQELPGSYEFDARPPAEAGSPGANGSNGAVPPGAIEKVVVSPAWVTEDDDPIDELPPAPAAESAPEPAAEPRPSEQSGPDYSVRVSAQDSSGVTDVPRWDTAERAAIRPDTEPPASRTGDQPAVRGGTGEQPAVDPRRRNGTGEQPAVHRNGTGEQPAVGAQWPRGGTGEQQRVDYDGACGTPPGLGEVDDETASFEPVAETQDLFHSPYEAEKTQQITRPPEDFDWNAGEPSAAPAAGSGGGEEQPPLGMAHRYRETDDAPTERLPIYEAVLSQWFREDVNEDDDSAPAATETTGSQSLSRDPLGGRGSSSGTGRNRARTEPDQEPAGPDPTAGADALGLDETSSSGAKNAESTGAPAAAQDPGWGSADTGWQAAEALVEQSRQVQETTAAGLPKRVPKSNLVPGSAAPRSSSPAPAKPAAARSAEAVRGRMSNFQSGIQRGRHAKAEPVSTEPPRRPEEQE